jgi:single-strand DNA-binding protein
MAVARFTLAVDRRMARTQNADQQSADFISCVAFRQRAEFAEKYLHQGTKVVLRGSLRTGSYTNKDGQKVYTTDVNVDDIEFAESKSAAANSGAAYSAPSSAPQPSAAAGDGFMDIADGVEDEGLPFN